MSDPSSLRVSDSDRERVAQELRDHYTDGRLNADELASRLEAVYASRTTAELAGVQADLPPLPISPARRRAEMAEYRRDLRRQLVQQTGGAFVPFLVCVAVWLSSGGQSNFWPGFVLIFPLIFLVRNGWALYGPAPDLERVEAELSHRRRGGHHHHRHRHGRGRYRPPGGGASIPPRGPGDRGAPQ